MLKSIVKNNSVKMSFSFLMGAIFVLTFASKENKDVMDLEQLKEIRYADISIDIIDDVNYPDHPDIVEALCIRKNDYPFIYLFKNPSNKIVKWSIVNGNEGLIALSRFDKGRISDFGIHGNKVHDNERMLVFSFTASDKPGVWQKVRYIPSSKTIMENGKLTSYGVIGELYEDIDFDGQFDAKRVFNEESEIVFEYIFLNGKWLVLDNRGSDEKIKKRGNYNLATLEAVTIYDKNVTYYDFEIGKGWKKRSTKSSRNK